MRPVLTTVLLALTTTAAIAAPPLPAPPGDAVPIHTRVSSPSTVPTTAVAGDAALAPRYLPGETIIIHDKLPPHVLPHPRKNYHRMAPPYSDAAIDRDVWANAWVLLDIDARGVVTRVKLVKRPGYDLDHIAVAHAMKMRFDPAEDASGHAMATQLLWSMEWPSYWWLVDMDEPPNRVPDRAQNVPCRGTGPMNMGSLHPTYRDCSRPDLTRLAVEPWVTQ